jgi:hypothetical protein
MRLRSFYFLLSVIFLNIPLYSQFDFYTGYQAIYDDNIYNNYEAVSDVINTFGLGTAYNSETENNNVQLFYEGSLSLFKTNILKNFNSHRIGLVETYLFSENSNPLNAGLNYSFRNNKDDFELFDFRQISAYINYRHSVSETDFILPGYLFNSNNYINFTLFSNYENKFFLAWSSSFETGTSFSLRGEAIYKIYVEQYDYPGYQNNATLLKLNFNTAQSLAERTGINGYFSYQKDFSEGSRYVLSDSLVYYEEEIFNNVYSFDSYEFGLGFRHFFGDNIQLSLEAKYLVRNFTALPAADIYGTELNYLREDKLAAFGAGLQFNLGSILNGLLLFTNLNYLKNSSNDYFYDFKNQILSASLEYGF